jgi:hypothetical protein
VSAGLYGSHAYLVAGYNASTDTFQLHNPWGVSHPGALSYSQLQAYCSMFVVADASGSNPVSGSVAATRPNPQPAPGQLIDNREEQSLSIADLDTASVEQRKNQPSGQFATGSTANSEHRSDGINRRRLTRLRINFISDDSDELDRCDISLPKDCLTELEFDLIDRLFTEQVEPIAG